MSMDRTLATLPKSDRERHLWKMVVQNAGDDIDSRILHPLNGQLKRGVGEILQKMTWRVFRFLPEVIGMTREQAEAETEDDQ